MNYWLLKTEPDTFSWDDLMRDKKATWDGVRNFQARSNLKAMKKGDWAFIYHTGEDKSVIGISEITREAYPDPQDAEWVVVDLKPVKKLKSSVTLAAVKKDKKLADMMLVRSARLSVQPVKKEEFDYVIGMSES